MKEIKTPSIDGKIIQQLNVEKLTTKYPPKEIEKALVNIFIKEREIELKNDFIRKKYLEAKEEIVEEVYSHLKKMNKELDLMLLEKYFESLLEKEQSGGAYYTPYFIVDFIVKNTIKKDTDIKIIDPACGSGSFLVGGSRELDSLSKKNLLQILEENIFGIDISENAIRRSKIILNLFALTNGIEDEYIDLNLVQANSLSLDFKEEFPNIFEEGGFDIVIGNPPYAPIPSYYNTDSMNDRYNTINSENKKGNLYLPFLELMMEISKDDNSRCGHIIPLSLSYHSGKMFQKFRKIIQESEDEWYFSFYDRSPDSLFGDNIRTRNSIIFLKKRKESRTRVHSTKMIRWNSNERDILFNKISYADISNLSIKEGIPKVSSELEVKVLKKLRSTFHLRNYLTNKETGSNNNLYFYSTAYN
ncbi:MAG: HsdM family class I SAM-dependent methyltransferase, partial [Thermoplasmatota archaeon]